MGYALPASMGAAFAGNNTVICITGDGGIQNNIQELATIHKHNLNIATIFSYNANEEVEEDDYTFFDDDMNSIDFINEEILDSRDKLEEYKVNDNTSLKFATRRNKEISLTEYYDLSYEYKNDCLTAALRFNKTFYKDKDLVPTEDLFFSITLVPLTTYEREIYKKTPGQSGLKGWFR